ncbi:mandelate racemase [Streptomyces sp. A3M-1-3]|uniref:mandelate racemase/muconate lactonizing enzyme family protein n=1 Tax=Streptomyces sp. A3M-1-3 TaxID=2962044 RepID=UPI0020B6E9AF|nr:enolase C-terminal domain-like protein [Streptomyces sp. A3M-1-3]MCP3820218.1 mandelate racemase [Streptomyces sp. A3M-1-3]
MSEALLYRVELPMRSAFEHPAARRKTSDSLVLRLDADGAYGVGECAPRSYVTGETSDGVVEALRRVPLDRVFARIRATAAAELLERLHADGFEAAFGVSGGSNLICLLETAVLDLLGKQLELSARELLGSVGSKREEPGRLPVSQVLDLSIDVEEFLATRGPFHFVKIKASEDIARDARTVRAIRDHVGDSVSIMVDANMSWTPENALGHAWRLRDCGVDLIEEPLPKGDWESLRSLRRGAGVGIMLDESVCTLDDARTAVEYGACDAVNVRVAKNGGVLRAGRLVGYAREHGLAFQFGVQVAEVGPLINASRALAFRHLDALTVEAGQSDRFFPEMIVAPPPAVDRLTNTIAPAGGHGFGVTLNDNAERWAALRFSEGRADWQDLAAR